VLLYLTGGGVWQDSTVHAHDVAATNFFDSNGVFVANVASKNGSSDDGVVCGWTGGAGAEWAFTDIASLGFEYRHNEFGDKTYHFDPHHGPVFPGSFKVDQSSDQLVFKINFLLGHVGN
jgi:opacity protein-like surface antigen